MTGGSPRVVLYGREGCAPCAHARDALRRLGREFAFELTERDVDAEPALASRYGDRVPVVAVGGAEVSEGRFDAAAVRRALAEAARAVDSNEGRS